VCGTGSSTAGPWRWICSHAGTLLPKNVTCHVSRSTVGGIFIGSRTGRALADNSDCAHWCNDHFPPGLDRGACKSNAADGIGLSHTPCGPDGGGRTLCGGPAYAATTCCSSGKVCVGGVCTVPSACAPGTVPLSNGTCAKQCNVNTPGSCSGSGCHCVTTDQGTFCATGNQTGSCPLSNNADCPKGSLRAGTNCQTVC
jgi:hypothetical protein